MALLPRRHKYNAQRTRGMDGCYYPSKCEAAVADRAFLWEKAGKIDGYECQHPVRLSFGIKWKVDFLVHTKAGDCLVEVKGFSTAEFRLKLKIYKGTDFEDKLPLFVYGHEERRGVFLKDSAWANGFEPPF